MNESTTGNFKSNFDLTNKWALISGAAGLLGKQHSISLLELNANVVLVDLDLKKLEKVKSELQENFPNQNILIFSSDISDENSVLQIQAELMSQHHLVSILINNAAINPVVLFFNLLPIQYIK